MLTHREFTISNSVSGFYQTLVAAASDASKVLVGTTAILDSVYLDVKPQAASIGQTINVPIPASVTASVADAGLGDPTLTDISFTTKSLVFNKHPQFGYIVRDFEQFNSPEAIRQVFLDAALKGILESIDTTLAGLINTTNFNSYTAISTTAHLITTAQFLSGYANLAAARVPVQDNANMSLLVAPTVYAAILGDSNWTQASIAGELVADQVRGYGSINSAYGAKIKFDQNMTTTGTAPTRTFTGAYMHRWALAVAARPLPAPDANTVDYVYLNLKGIPVRVSVGYSILKSGYVVNVDAGYAAGVLRSEMCQMYTTSE